MADGTGIEWTKPPGFRGATWNPIVGCRRISPGCEHCYAETMAGRLARMGQARYLDVVKLDGDGQPRGRWNGSFREVPEALMIPLRTRKPTCYFVNSMSDLFGEGVSDEWIAAVFGVMAACPQHRFQVLTKRAERMAAWFRRQALVREVCEAHDKAFMETLRGKKGAAFNRAYKRHDGSQTAWTHRDGAAAEMFAAKEPGRAFPSWVRWPLSNVWIGVSVEDQQRADERIPHLLRVPAAVRFLSVEPMLGPIDMEVFLSARVCTEECAADPMGCDHDTAKPALHWVIVGGESGGGARPFDLAWARSIVEQCKAAGVACFVKQLGAAPELHGHAFNEVHVNIIRDRKGGDPSEWPEDLRVRQWPEVSR